MHEFHLLFHVILSRNRYIRKPTPKYVWYRVKKWITAGYNFKECKALIEKTYPIENSFAEGLDKRERRLFSAKFREIDYNGVIEGF